MGLTVIRSLKGMGGVDGGESGGDCGGGGEKGGK